MWWIIGIIAWLACGIIHAGYYFCYFQTEYPDFAVMDYVSDLCLAYGLAIFGPIAFFATSISGFCRHGFRLW
jgi:hypothetical protein